MTRFQSALIGLFAFCIPAIVLAQPANDDCTSATPVGEGTFAFDNTGSAVDGPSACDGNMASDVWFLYTPSADGLATLSTCVTDGAVDTLLDTVIIAYDGAVCPMAGDSGIDCSDDDCPPVGGGSPFLTEVQIPVVSTNTYYIQVGGWNGAEGTAQLLIDLAPATPEICNDGIDNDADGLTDCDDPDCAADAACLPPVNDNCVDAITIAENTTTAWSTFLATDEGTFSCRGLDDVWFELTPSTDGELELSLTNLVNAAGFGTDTNHSIYLNSSPGNCPTDADEVGCFDPATGLASVMGGQSYLIRIGAWSTGGVNQFSGDLTVTLTAGTPEICDDGIDNDFDGFIDCADADCTGISPCGAEVCDDGIDNDGDGDTDCDDADCGADPVCATPANDECGGALVVGLGVTTLDTTLATDSAEAVPATCTNSPGSFANDVWLSFTPATDGSLTISTCDDDSFDTSIATYTGGCGALVEGPCIGDAPGDPACQTFFAELSLDVTGGTEYLIRIGGFGASAFGVVDVELTLETPDECGGAFEVFDGVNALDTTGFTTSPDTPTGCSNSFGGMNNDIWTFYTTTGDGTLILDTCDIAGFDTDLALYTGDCDNLNLVACDGDGNGDAGCQLFDSRIEQEVVGGTTFLIRLGGFGSGDAGPQNLNITFIPTPPVINEIRIDQPSGDDDEYFELSGQPQALDGLSYIVIGDGSGGSGTIENVTDLTGLSISGSGYFLATESTFTIGAIPADLVTSLNFENSDNVTHLLVRDFSGADGDDLDTNDDGELDIEPWSEIVDCIALVEVPDSSGPDDEFFYCDNTIGPDGTFVPGHVERCPDTDGGFFFSEFDPAMGDDSPGEENSCDTAFIV